MSYVYLTALIAVSVLNPCSIFGASGLVPSSVNVGTRLETAATVSLGEPAPGQGLDITLRSSDPAKLLIAKLPNESGAASLVVRVRQGFRESPEFWLQGLGGPGTVTYTADAPGFSTGTGTVTLTPSAILIRGPIDAARFITTTGSPPSRIRLTAVRLDASLKVAEEQAVAGGHSVRVEVTSSNKAGGTIIDSPQEIQGGANAAAVMFRPAAEGETKISAGVLPGFSEPAEFATVTAVVQKPGIAVTDEIVVGENLEVGGVLILAEPPSGSGTNVTLVSDDPGRLLLSTSPKAVGSKSITVKMLPNGKTGQYFLQALGSSGTVIYTASAPGYRGRTGTVTLTPSGVVLTPISQGPPDEAHVLRKEGAGDSALSYPIDLSQSAPTTFVVWMVQLDPTTHRGADITVQPLRGGLSVVVPLNNSNPAVGKIAASVTIQGGSDQALADFTPTGAGSTEISVTTPKNFTQAANSTVIRTVVRD